jgi:hypothetical protein
MARWRSLGAGERAFACEPAVPGRKNMRVRNFSLLILGSIGLTACAQTEDVAVAPAPPVGPGAIVGTVAADRNGDGIVDGYYTSDGIYQPFQAPPCPLPPPPPPPPAPTGERG